ncbi:hypothetical protein, partial [Pseudoalteromonas tetraodonis]|uniref:hypothetical protein n=1 Tax=Pseudoalteromonas tetraodonis TaxID=43659 RepID=UPI00300146AF
TKLMTVKFDDLLSQIDALDQAHFGEQFSMRSDSDQWEPFTGVMSDSPIVLDAAETIGYTLEVPMSLWQGSYPRKNKHVVTRLRTGEEYTVHSSRIVDSDLIINLVN